MFAAAKKGNRFWIAAFIARRIRSVKKVEKKISKKDLKSIAGIKKGFYICTRLTRKRVKEREKKFIDILN